MTGVGRRPAPKSAALHRRRGGAGLGERLGRGRDPLGRQLAVIAEQLAELGPELPQVARLRQDAGGQPLGLTALQLLEAGREHVPLGLGLAQARAVPGGLSVAAASLVVALVDAVVDVVRRVVRLLQ